MEDKVEERESMALVLIETAISAVHSQKCIGASASPHLNGHNQVESSRLKSIF